MKPKTSSFQIACLFLLLSGIYTDITAQSERPLKQRPKTSGMFGRRDTLDRKGVFTCYPTNFVASTLKVGYEFKVAHNKGLKFIGSFGSSQGSSDFYNLDKFDEFGFEAQLRFYVLKGGTALNGLYLAPYALYKSMTYSGSTDGGLVGYVGPGPAYVTNGTASDVSVGYVIGYQYIFNSTFSIDLFAGGGDNFISGNASGGSLASTVYEYRSGIDFHSGIGIGIAF